MHQDRRIYITTGVLAVVLATAISVLMPRDPFAGTIVHREAGAVSRAAQANSPHAVEVAIRAVQQRLAAAL